MHDGGVPDGEVAGDLFAQLLEPAALANPYPLYACLRDHQPAYRLPSGERVFSRYHDVAVVLRDPRFGRPRFPKLPLRAVRVLFRMFLLLDPPDHTRIRRVVAPFFTSTAIADLRPTVEDAAEAILARTEPGMDVVKDLAQPLPLAVIAEILGVPPAHRARLAGWSKTLVDALDSPVPFPMRSRAMARALPHGLRSRSHVAETLHAASDVVAYARDCLSDHRRRPRGHGLLAALAAAPSRGTLSEDEAVASWVLLLIAGHETTANLIGNATLCLLRHPDALVRLRADPSRIPSAVEESLRYESPVPRAGRIARDDLMVGETLVRRGEFVHALLGAANRDPAAFPNPDSFDIDRPTTPTHVGFGAGIHFCLGAGLARLETEVALSSLLRRRPDLALGADDVAWRASLALRGPISLPIETTSPLTSS